MAKCKVLHAGRINRMKEYTMEGKILKKSTGGERLGSDGTQSNEWKQTGH